MYCSSQPENRVIRVQGSLNLTIAQTSHLRTWANQANSLLHVRGPNLGAPHQLGATPSRTPRAGAGGHPGPHPLPRARHGPPPTERNCQRHQRVGAGNMGSPDGLPEQLKAPRPGGHPRPRRPPASPLHVHDPHVQSALHPLRHPLPRTNWPLGGARHRLPPPRRLRPPCTQPRPRHVRQGGRAGRPPPLGHVGTQVPGHAALHPQRQPGPW